MEVFTRDPKDTLPFDKFLDGVVVVSLDALGQDDRSKNMLVAVMLNMFYENMLSAHHRPRTRHASRGSSHALFQEARLSVPGWDIFERSRSAAPRAQAILEPSAPTTVRVTCRLGPAQ